MEIANAEYDFSFDRDGRFIFLQSYILGATKDIGRYRENYKYHTDSNSNDAGVGLTGLFNLFHDFSCVVEDLDVITGFMEAGDFIHPKHKLWKQIRHHVRHDLGDLKPTEDGAAMTRTRKKYLKTPANMFSELIFEENLIKISGRELNLDEASEYINWADEILGKYVEWSRKTGHLKPAVE